MKLDALIFAAHPDDAELSMSGTIVKLTNSGLKVGVVDLCRGEMGSRGTMETRKSEWEKASQIMNLSERVNLKLPDGGLRPNPEFVKKVVEQIRRFQPKIVFAPHWHDRHPDHIGTSKIVKEAYFLAGNYKYNSEWDNHKQEPYRPKKMFYFMLTYDFEPTFIIDISSTYDKRIEAIKAYGTQFYNPENKSDDPQTFISKPDFTDYLEARSRVYGFRIGKKFGEPFYCEESIEYDFSKLLTEES